MTSEPNTMTAAAEDVAGPVFLRLGKCFLNGIGTEKDARSALICYQRAEVHLHNMVRKGNRTYKKSLRAAIDGQEKARAVPEAEITAEEWFDE